MAEPASPSLHDPASSLFAPPTCRAFARLPLFGIEALDLRAKRTTDFELLARDADLLQCAESVLRHAFGKIDEAMVPFYDDLADMPTLQVRFIRDRRSEERRVGKARTCRWRRCRVAKT